MRGSKQFRFFSCYLSRCARSKPTLCAFVLQPSSVKFRRGSPAGALLRNREEPPRQKHSTWNHAGRALRAESPPAPKGLAFACGPRGPPPSTVAFPCKSTPAEGPLPAFPQGPQNSPDLPWGPSGIRRPSQHPNSPATPAPTLYLGSSRNTSPARVASRWKAAPGALPSAPGSRSSRQCCENTLLPGGTWRDAAPRRHHAPPRPT